MVRWMWVGVFFFKQKTAYDMRISDWSSDVCSSDLSLPQLPAEFAATCPRCSKARADPLAQHVALELRDAGQHRRHHPPVGCIDLESHAAHRAHRHAPA